MRNEQWLSALDAYISGHQKTPFAWGTHDCAMHAANAILSMTGVDVMAEYRGTYHDEDGANANLKGGTVEDAMDEMCKKHNFLKPLPNVNLAQRGDVVSFLLNGQITLGVVGMNGKDCWFTGDVLTKVSLSLCKRAWAVR